MPLRLGPEVQALLRQELTASRSELVNRGGGLTHTLEEENTKLKRLVADLSLDKAMLQDVLAKKP